MNSNERDMIAAIREAAETSEGMLVQDGRLVTERKLMEIFDVSRRSVRTVLAELEKQGMLFRQRGQGTFLGPTSPNTHRIENIANCTSPSEIMEVRREIEPALAKLAALRATPQDIDQMRRLVDRGAASETSKEYERWDAAFHNKLAASARNGLFLALVNMIQAVRVEQKWTSLRSRVFSKSLRDELVTEHRGILESIERRDMGASEIAMRKHLHHVSDFTKDDISQSV